MELLVLGGTAFLGRAVAQTARDRGLAVTCAARGSGPPPDGVDFVRVDRDPDDGLAPLTGRHWDAVIDVARQPGHVRRAVRDLDAGHWAFVSTSNVYARSDRPGSDENAELLEPLAGDLMEDMEQYGPAKVACEEAVRATPVTATIVRAGLIGGYGDVSGRTGYYPWRFAHPTGPDVLVPDDPGFPCAILDVGDLAAWLVDCAQRRVDGTFNAAGPVTALDEVVETARRVADDSAPPPRRVPLDVLAGEGVAAWMGPRSLPLWVDDPDWRFFADHDTSRARAAGLHARPLAETLARALAYEEEERVVPRGAGLTDEDERALRAVLDGA